MRDKDREILQDFLKSNPTAPYSEFKKVHRHAQVSDCTYYNYRRKQNGTSSVNTGSRKQKIFITVFSMPNTVSKETKKALNDFVSALNQLKRSKLEIIEAIDSKQLEVRELKVI